MISLCFNKTFLTAPLRQITIAFLVPVWDQIILESLKGFHTIFPPLERIVHKGRKERKKLKAMGQGRLIMPLWSWGPVFNSRIHRKSQAWWCIFIILPLRRQRWSDLWCLLARQRSWADESGIWVKDLDSRKMTDCLRGNRVWPLASTYTQKYDHIHIYTYTNMHIQTSGDPRDGTLHRE